MIVDERKTYVAQMLIKENFRREKSIIIPKSFNGKVGEDPTFFLKNLIVNAEANG